MHIHILIKDPECHNLKNVSFPIKFKVSLRKGLSKSCESPSTVSITLCCHAFHHMGVYVS
jgi:hypothetical protein